jgi:hypothetical protein
MEIDDPKIVALEQKVPVPDGIDVAPPLSIPEFTNAKPIDGEIFQNSRDLPEFER